MRKGIVLFFFAVCTCYGQWSQWPLSTDTNRYNWEDCRTNWQQLITAVIERGAATEVPAYSNFEIVAEYAQPAGYSNDTVVWIAEGFPCHDANFAYTVNASTSWIASNVKGCYLDKSGIFETYLYYSGTSYYGDALLSFGTTNWYTDSAMTSRIVGAKTYVTNSFTNSYQLWTNVTMTNLNATIYSVGGVTYTGYPYLSQDAINQLDTRIKLLIPYYARTNEAGVDGSFDTWFALGSGTNHPQSIPMWNGAALFSQLGIGYVTNITISTNAWGSNLVSGGDYYFTRYPVQTGAVWTLFESAYHGYWTTNVIASKDIQYYDAGLPKAVYITTGSIPSISFTINGLRFLTGQTNQEKPFVTDYTTNDSETISISAMTNSLTKMWYSISNVTCVSVANTGDVLAIQYVNPHKTFGSHPFTLYSEDFDERWRVLDSLRWTSPQLEFISGGELWEKNSSVAGEPIQTNTLSWGQAMSLAAASNPVAYSPWSHYAGRVTYGSVNSNSFYNEETGEWDIVVPFYIAQILWASNGVALKTATNQTTKAYLYFKTGTNDPYGRPQEWDDQYDTDYGPIEQYKEYSVAYTISNSHIQTLTNWYGGTNTPSGWRWCDEPIWDGYHNTNKIKGYYITGVESLFKWDELTNSFKMK